MYRLRVKTHFDAAHYIKDYEGKCSREHGHRWGVDVVLEGIKLHTPNMLVDFVDVKRALTGVIDDKLDHYQLNECLHEPNVTAEFLARWIYEEVLEDLRGRLPFQCGLRLVEVTVWESPDCGVSYDEST